MNHGTGTKEFNPYGDGEEKTEGFLSLYGCERHT
jgi:hypothetical protein